VQGRSMTGGALDLRPFFMLIAGERASFNRV
jgi:hypothetical protein